jgi:hypothetical protein
VDVLEVCDLVTKGGGKGHCLLLSATRVKIVSSSQYPAKPSWIRLSDVLDGFSWIGVVSKHFVYPAAFNGFDGLRVFQSEHSQAGPTALSRSCRCLLSVLAGVGAWAENKSK